MKNSLLAEVNTTPIASEGTIKTALEFHFQGWLATAIFEILAGTDPSGFEAQRKFCQSLWHLGPSFEKNQCTEEALMTYNLIHAGYQVTRCSSTDKKNIKCLVYRARVLRKMKKMDQSEALYQEAMKALQERGDGNCGLECLFDLADFLSDRDMEFEALSLLVHAYFRECWYINTSAESQKMLELLNYVQRIHSKTETGEGLARVTAIISRLRTIQKQWIDTHNYQNLFFELGELRGHYSNSEKFKLADLCFRFPAPRENAIANPKNRLKLAQFLMERSVNCVLEGENLESLKYLTYSFKGLLSLGPDGCDGMEEEEMNLLLCIEQLLGKFYDEKFRECHSEAYSVATLAWEKANAAFDQSQAHGLVFNSQKKPGLNAHQGGISISSNGSSVSSRASLNSFGVTYSVGSASSIVSNSVFMVP
jgi:tetratricopeptide (TPR) repeat protein